MRRLIAGNWKMHGLSAELPEIEAVATFVATARPEADTLICVPATLISRAVQTVSGRIAIGGEDCREEGAEGAFAEMLIDAGASAVILGHSERRRYHEETDANVVAEAKAARSAGLPAIICIGEAEAQRRDGQALSVCDDQIVGSVPEDSVKFGNLSIAYEPLWAIGS